MTRSVFQNFMQNEYLLKISAKYLQNFLKLVVTGKHWNLYYSVHNKFVLELFGWDTQMDVLTCTNKFCLFSKWAAEKKWRSKLIHNVNKYYFVKQSLYLNESRQIIIAESKQYRRLKCLFYTIKQDSPYISVTQNSLIWQLRKYPLLSRTRTRKGSPSGRIKTNHNKLKVKFH